MVGCTKRLRKRAKAPFAEPPWNERSDEWQIRNQQVSAEHPARAVVEAMKQLDLTPLFNLYLGVGVPPIRPDLMLAVVLIEIHAGRPQPSQWFRDTQENIVLQWAGFGIRPSRTCWYNFADRVAPLLEQWNATVLQLARQRGVTRAERMSLDGTSVAANASRHRLVNEATIEQRLSELENACQADAVNQPPPGVPAWMAKNPDTREGQRRRYLLARERLIELHAVNNRQDPKRRRKREKIVVSTSDPHRARMATAEAKGLYRLRSQTVELGFADFKFTPGLYWLRQKEALTPLRTHSLGNNLLQKDLRLFQWFLGEGEGYPASDQTNSKSPRIARSTAFRSTEQQLDISSVSGSAEDVDMIARH